MSSYIALKVEQPFGCYYVVKMTAYELLKVTFSDPLRYDEVGNLKGNQRKIVDSRINEIGEFIRGHDAAFPNSIIISANYMEDGSLCTDEQISWKLEKNKYEDSIYELTIPTEKKLASVIDGQHRLNGFYKVDEKRQKEIELLVCVYMNLPNPYQAFIFATINYNQKAVDKSVALEQWGFSLESDPSISWSPELLAVFLTKKMNQDESSLFYKRVRIAPQNPEYYYANIQSEPLEKTEWTISTAAMVDNIVKLISSNPKRDLNKLRLASKKERKREILEDNSNLPLRKYYLESNDMLIYTIINNYFKAVSLELFKETTKTSFIKKTVGIQALFDVLKEILLRNLEKDKDISVEYFKEIIGRASKIDFTDDFFTASGIGKSRIKNIILLSLDYIKYDDIRNIDQIPDYKNLLS